MDKVVQFFTGSEQDKEGDKSKQEHSRNDSAIGGGEPQTKGQSESKGQDETADTGELQDAPAGAKNETPGGFPDTEPEKDDSQVESKEPFSGAAEPTEPEGQAEADKPSDDKKDENEGTSTEEMKDAGIHETQPDLLEASQDTQPSIDDAQKKAAENDPISESQGETGGHNDSEPPAASKDDNQGEEVPKDKEEGGDNQDDSTTGLKGAVAEAAPHQDDKTDDKPEGGEQSSQPSGQQASPPEPTQEKPEGGEQSSQPSGQETSPPEDSQEKPEEKSEPALGEKSEVGAETHQDEGEKPSAQEGGQDGDKPESGENEAEAAGVHKTEPDLLEASQTDQPSVDDAREQAKENAPEVREAAGGQTGEDEQQSKDEPKAGEEQQGSGESGTALESSEPADANHHNIPSGTDDANKGDEAKESDETKAEENAPQPGGSNIESGGGDKPESNEQGGDGLESDKPAGEDKANEAKDAGLHETQPDLLEASQHEQPSADEARDKAKENAPTVEGIGDQQSGDKPEGTEPSDESTSKDLPKQDEPSADVQEPPSTESKGEGVSGTEPSGEKEPEKTEDSAPQAADSTGGPESKGTELPKPDSGDAQPKSSMLDDVLGAGDSAKQDSDLTTQTELPDRSKAGDIGDDSKPKVDTPIADQQATPSGAAPAGNDAEEEEEDDAEGKQAPPVHRR